MNVDDTRLNTVPDIIPLPDELQAIRSSVLNKAVIILAVAVPAVSLVFFFQMLVLGELDKAFFVRAALTLIFPMLAILRSRLPFNVVAILLLVFLVFTGFTVSIRGGISAGNIVINIIALLLGALFFGRTGALLVFLGIIGFFALAGTLLVNGVVEAPNPALWDQLSGRYWFRQAIIFTIFGMAMVATQLYINERLIALSENTRRMAEIDKQQRLAMEESHRLEALSRLSGGIAHDFNNTLVVMLGNAELALMDLDDKEAARTALEKIIAAGGTASNMTRQLLTLGRKTVTTPAHIAIGEHLERINASLERLLPANIRLDIAVSGNPTCFVDPVMFERAIYNLVLNARDAMPDGGTVTVRSETSPANTDVDIRVSDEGVGIDAETLQRIFDPYFTTKGKSGTGLGLAILRAWVEASGGRIDVASAPGSGSTFTLRLPAAG